MSEQNLLPWSESIHTATEAWGPDSPFGHLLTYLLLILPLAWLTIKGLFSKRPILRPPTPPQMPQSPTPQRSSAH